MGDKQPMDEEKTLLDIECYSENTHDSIGCGVFVSNLHPSAEDFEIEDIIESLEESFWELLCDFESSAQQAFDDGKISGTEFDDLFKVFGHFHFSCTIEKEPIKIDLGINPDEYMYPLLVEYIEIDAMHNKTSNQS